VLAYLVLEHGPGVNSIILGKSIISKASVDNYYEFIFNYIILGTPFMNFMDPTILIAH